MAAFSGSHAGSVFSVKLIHISADEGHANRMRQSFNCSVGVVFPSPTSGVPSHVAETASVKRFSATNVPFRVRPLLQQTSSPLELPLAGQGYAEAYRRFAALQLNCAVGVFHSWFHLLSLANLKDGREIAAC